MSNNYLRLQLSKETIFTGGM